jgi:cytochrome P450
MDHFQREWRQTKSSRKLACPSSYSCRCDFCSRCRDTIKVYHAFQLTGGDIREQDAVFEYDYLELLKLPLVGSRHATSLNDIIKESMRLHVNSLVGALRLLPEDFILEDGILLPAKAAVMVATYTIHRSESIFQKADAFVPRRSEDATPEMQKSLMGFRLGRRNWQGQALAKVELSVILAKLWCACEWSGVEWSGVEWSATAKCQGIDI